MTLITACPGHEKGEVAATCLTEASFPALKVTRAKARRPPRGLFRSGLLFELVLNTSVLHSYTVTTPITSRRISNTTATSDVDKPLCAYWQDSAVYFCGVLGFLHKKKRVFFYSLLLFLVGLAGFFSFATEGVW